MSLFFPETQNSPVDAGQRGLPRPILDGLPAPYSGDDAQHGLPDDQRTMECLTERICAVCGKDFAEDDRLYTACYYNLHDTLVDDGLLMHERCAKIALAHCPHMRHGFSKVFWVQAEELYENEDGRELDKPGRISVDERRLMISSTSADPDEDQPWRPANEIW